MSKPQPPLIETERLLLTWPTPEQIDGYYDSIIGTNIFDTIFWDGPSHAHSSFKISIYPLKMQRMVHALQICRNTGFLL